MRTETISNELRWGISMFLAVLIAGCASSRPITTGTWTMTPILPKAEEIIEDYNPSFATGLEKVFLGTIKSEGVAHQHSTSISTDGSKVAYRSSTDKIKSYMIIENLKTHEFVKGPEFEIVTLPTFSPDGGKIAYAAKQENKWFIMIDNKKCTQFDNISAPPVFSPDGSKIAYAAIQGSKYFIMINDKKGPEFDGVYSEIAFSPDSSKVAYGAKQGVKSFIIVDGKKGPEFDGVGSPTFNPMGDKVAYIAVQGDKVFVVVDDKKGPEFDGARRDVIFSPDGKKLAYVAVRTTEHKTSESLIVVLELNNGDLTLYKTFGPLNVSVTTLQPLTMANISGVGWSPTFNVDGSKIAYGVNGGASEEVKEPRRTNAPGRHYYIERSIGNSTIEIDGEVVANINNTGLVTPLSFSLDGKELRWLVLTEDSEIYLKKLKLK